MLTDCGIYEHVKVTWNFEYVIDTYSDISTYIYIISVSQLTINLVVCTIFFFK